LDRKLISGLTCVCIISLSIMAMGCLCYSSPPPKKTTVRINLRPMDPIPLDNLTLDSDSASNITLGTLSLIISLPKALRITTTTLKFIPWDGKLALEALPKVIIPHHYFEDHTAWEINLMVRTVSNDPDLQRFVFFGSNNMVTLRPYWNTGDEFRIDAENAVLANLTYSGDECSIKFAPYFSLDIEEYTETEVKY
jgi:hypothetical protein